MLTATEANQGELLSQGPVRFFAYVTTTSETRVLPATGRFKHSDDGIASVVKAMSLGRMIVQGAMYRQFKGGDSQRSRGV